MFEQMQHAAIGELNETDACLRNLENLIRILAMGMPDCGDPDAIGDAMTHIADAVRNIRARVDEATQAVMQLRSTAA